MALIRCPDCDREISDKAPACPHCGMPADARPTPPVPSPAPAPAEAPHVVLPPYVESRQHTTWPKVAVALLVLFLIVAAWNSLTSDDANPIGSASTVPTAAPAQPDPAVELASLVRAIDDEGATRRARLASAKLLVSRHPDAPDRERADALIEQLEAEIIEESRGAQWDYSVHTDDMSGRESKSARVRSTNSFQFDFPYNERQHAVLTLRRHPRHGNDVIFSIEHGQILCRSYDGCRVRVRFDDGPMRTLIGTGPADNSSNTVFIPGYNDFLQRLGKATTVRIEVDIFREGALVAEFNVDGIKQERLK